MKSKSNPGKPRTRVVELVVRTGAVEEWLALILALIAYPAPEEAATRKQAQRKLHGALLERALLAGRRPVAGLSDYERESVEIFWRARSRFTALAGRLHRRLAAGNGATALLFSANGMAVGFPEDFGPRTLESFFAWAANHGEGNEDNFKGRHFNKSLPVLNMLIALCVLLYQRGVAGRPLGDILDAALDSDLMGQWIGYSNRLIWPVAEHWRRRYQNRELIELQLSAPCSA